MQCPTCKQFGYALMEKKDKGDNIRLGLERRRARGLRLGCPRKVPYETIWELLDSGLTMREVKAKTGASMGSIQNAKIRRVK